MSQYDPFWRALADLQRIAGSLGCQVSAIVVNNIEKPPLPDWDAERKLIQEKQNGQG